VSASICFKSRCCRGLAQTMQQATWSALSISFVREPSDSGRVPPDAPDPRTRQLPLTLTQSLTPTHSLVYSSSGPWTFIRSAASHGSCLRDSQFGTSACGGLVSIRPSSSFALTIACIACDEMFACMRECLPAVSDSMHPSQSRRTPLASLRSVDTYLRRISVALFAVSLAPRESVRLCVVEFASVRAGLTTSVGACVCATRAGTAEALAHSFVTCSRGAGTSLDRVACTHSQRLG
jgi:hypothetical protein